MTPEQRRLVCDLFERAIEYEPSEEAHAWVVRETAGEPVVRDEVLSLLDHHSRAGEFLLTPIVEGQSSLLDEDLTLAPGTTVGQYSIIRELGRGGMGRVYLASDVRLGRTVALKALAPGLLRDPAHRERLRREARAAATLSHPGICTVYALEEIDGELYISSEFIDGVTLGYEIRQGRRPSPDEVMHTARELALALANAHAHGVVHRDLKPDNVMRGRDGRLKILDFGLARVVRPTAHAPDDGNQPPDAPWLTTAGVIVGTPAYMAPEQINGQPVDARADVFAFGVLLYELACGTHPFQAATPLATMARILESDARPQDVLLPSSPAVVAAAVARCLRKNPDDRFASAAEIVDALAAPSSVPRLLRPTALWWRNHQLAIIALYIASAVMAWWIKDWDQSALRISIFVTMGALAAVGGVLRGHLIFTEWINRPHLAAERRRTGRAILLLDLSMSALLLLDGLVLASTHALPAVWALGLAAGLALAATVLEPATIAATFGRDGT